MLKHVYFRYGRQKAKEQNSIRHLFWQSYSFNICNRHWYLNLKWTGTFWNYYFKQKAIVVICENWQPQIFILYGTILEWMKLMDHSWFFCYQCWHTQNLSVKRHWKIELKASNMTTNFPLTSCMIFSHLCYLRGKNKTSKSDTSQLLKPLLGSGKSFSDLRITVVR